VQCHDHVHMGDAFIGCDIPVIKTQILKAEFLTQLVAVSDHILFQVQPYDPDRIGYRSCIVGAHLFAGTGLIGLSILPDLLSHPYTGLVLSVSCYAIGGGLIEVMLSPIVQACPVSQKSSAMCFLHSFNCWGQVLVVLISTLFFSIAGIEHWSWIVRMWACIPLLNALYFSAVPLRTLAEEERGASIREMCPMKLFWIFMLLMLCSGGAEQAMSQWASAFAEMGLHVSKTAGDLAGPCMFALLMGTSRIFYAKYSEKINLQNIFWEAAYYAYSVIFLHHFRPFLFCHC